MLKLSIVMLVAVSAIAIVIEAQVPAPLVQPGAGFAAIPGAKGGQDTFGAYEVVKDWPKNISTLPGNEKWTWGAGQNIYAESPNRIFLVFRGELPNIKRPETRLIPEFGPSLQYPIGRLPWREAPVAALPGAGGTGR